MLTKERITNKKKTLAIIGGTQEETLKKLGKKGGFRILYDNAYRPKRKKYEKIISSSDCVVVMVGACSHRAMWMAKEISGMTDTPIRFVKGRGVTGAILKGMEEIEKERERKVM